MEYHVWNLKNSKNSAHLCYYKIRYSITDLIGLSDLEFVKDSYQIFTKCLQKGSADELLSA